MVETLEPDIEAQRDALADRLFTSANATFDLAAVYLGDRLGLLLRELAEPAHQILRIAAEREVESSSLHRLKDYVREPL